MIEYDNTADHWHQVISGERREAGESWLRTDTLDYWRHSRQFAPLQGLVTLNPDASWLTVGDGRFGSDANHLMRLGAASVHATDMNDELLREANERGYVDSYSKENGEALSFKDNSFEFTLCKEALHHFPRPYAGLYEMLRVSRRAVALIEPRDRFIDRTPFDMLRQSLQSAFGFRGKKRYSFEEVGNFMYTISERELEKVMLGLHLTTVAFAGLNDAYFAGVEFATYPASTPQDIKTQDKLKRAIRNRDLECKLGFRRSSLLLALLFKEEPTKEERHVLTESGFKFSILPKNPYR